MTVSGFTFIHNALDAGYPIFEAMSVVLPFVDQMVVVDMQSDDGTRGLLDRVASGYPCRDHIRVVDGEWWPGMAGRCLSYNHSLHSHHCDGDITWHFEADEVYDPRLARQVSDMIRSGAQDIAVMRLQVEQNFQRVRWYPEAVHRIFPTGTVAKSGHTTTRHADADVVPAEYGYLWDVTNCFRDLWASRVRQQAELWGDDSNLLFVPLHAAHAHRLDACSPEVYRAALADFLEQPHWYWKSSPLRLPAVLEAHLGKMTYVPRLDFLEIADA